MNIISTFLRTALEARFKKAMDLIVEVQLIKCQVGIGVRVTLRRSNEHYFNQISNSVRVGRFTLSNREKVLVSGGPVFVLVLLLVPILLLTSCTSLSGNKLDDKHLHNDTDPLIEDLREFDNQERTNDAVELYKQSKVECGSLGGTWVGLLHGDSRDTHTNFYRCRSNEDSLPYTDEKSWSRKGLVPYDLAVTYSNLTSKVVSFTRVYLDLDESDKDSQQ